MDTSIVIQLTCQAAESVLRFRAVGFTGRPVIDVQEFRATITTEIERIAKKNGNSAVVPLAQVADYAGIGAAWAALRWNRANRKENHVSTEWYRNCVSNLVSGVATDIASQALTGQGMNVSTYLDPDPYNPFNGAGSARPVPTQESSPYVPGAANVNREAGKAWTGPVEIDDTTPVPSASPSTLALGITSSEPRPARSEAGKRRATSPATGGAREDLTYTGSHPGNQPESSGGTAPPNLLSIRPAKRNRLPDSAPPRQSTSQRSAGNEASSSVSERSSTSVGSNPSILAGHMRPRQIRRHPRWTEDEANIVREARERGENWVTIQTMVPRHTKEACQSKYQTIIGNRARSDAARMASQRAGFTAINRDN